ncbi:hypothetical protein [Ructibacterium gallinarum]|uniref:Uncharacterized protein n=1 Tax=Ructibacterium gallinarum TaxID=2779355 RepID=A0A9D5RCI4_9FIRM|nr:hypothetical protein [Ructibacterium gallinarum]MBE5041023.1 hypothetical protein [Ructibacterium gallinarum]
MKKRIVAIWTLLTFLFVGTGQVLAEETQSLEMIMGNADGVYEFGETIELICTMSSIIENADFYVDGEKINNDPVLPVNRRVSCAWTPSESRIYNVYVIGNNNWGSFVSDTVTIAVSADAYSVTDDVDTKNANGMQENGYTNATSANAKGSAVYQGDEQSVRLQYAVNPSNTGNNQANIQLSNLNAADMVKIEYTVAITGQGVGDEEFVNYNYYATGTSFFKGVSFTYNHAADTRLIGYYTGQTAFTPFKNQDGSNMSYLPGAKYKISEYINLATGMGDVYINGQKANSDKVDFYASKYGDSPISQIITVDLRNNNKSAAVGAATIYDMAVYQATENTTEYSNLSSVNADNADHMVEGAYTLEMQDNYKGAVTYQQEKQRVRLQYGANPGNGGENRAGISVPVNHGGILKCDFDITLLHYSYDEEFQLYYYYGSGSRDYFKGITFRHTAAGVNTIGYYADGTNESYTPFQTEVNTPVTYTGSTRYQVTMYVDMQTGLGDVFLDGEKLNTTPINFFASKSSMAEAELQTDSTIQKIEFRNNNKTGATGSCFIWRVDIQEAEKVYGYTASAIYDAQNIQVEDVLRTPISLSKITVASPENMEMTLRLTNMEGTEIHNETVTSLDGIYTMNLSSVPLSYGTTYIMYADGVKVAWFRTVTEDLFVKELCHTDVSDGVSASDVLKGKAMVENYSGKFAAPYLIAAIYSDDGTLKTVSHKKSMSYSNQITGICTTDVAVPEDYTVGNYIMCVFCWDDFTTMQPCYTDNVSVVF